MRAERWIPAELLLNHAAALDDLVLPVRESSLPSTDLQSLLDAGLSVNEIAEMRGVSRSAIDVAIHRARKRERTEVKG